MTRRTQLPGSSARDHLLSPRRQKILTFIRESVERRGYPPTIREIADAVGLKSTSAVSYQLKVLEQTGHLTRDAGMPRTVVEKLPRPRWRHRGGADRGRSHGQDLPPRRRPRLA